MRAIITLILLLLAVPACAGPEVMMSVLNRANSPIAFTVNGYTAITSDSGEAGGPIALNDTGTENGISTGAGEVSVVAYCSATAEALASVFLVVDGTPQELFCNYSEIKSGVKLSHTVTAGTHNIRVYGTLDAGAYFSADTFRKPRP